MKQVLDSIQTFSARIIALEQRLPSTSQSPSINIEAGGDYHLPLASSYNARRDLMRTNAYPPPPHHPPTFKEHMRSYFYQNVDGTERIQWKAQPLGIIDWLNVVDDYFEWFEMSKLRKSKLVKTKLTSPAREWWKIHENRMLAKDNPITTREEMKDDLKDNSARYPIHG
ncbi:hypothetical protein NE237_015864 [Protea cynaroides]|uniref:Uncharacterized protein n=1 Tax=Protea cynaroides TaxID=273540 RepID=A0A9Q0QRH7_9MAGN|nr:hypothetical protein NE237_015864 [Protea cynaroides]